MANISYQDIDPAQVAQFYHGLTPQSQFLYSRIKKKTGLLSKRRILHIASRSFLPQIASVWATMTSLEKALWTICGAYSHLNGWRSFVAEQSIRIKLGLTLPNIPVIEHQAWIGHLQIAGSATQIQIGQFHPSAYYIHKKVTGVKGLYAPVLVNEQMSLPFEIGLSYKSDLTPTGAQQYAKFYVTIISSYQGVDRFTDLVIDLNPSTDWMIDSATLIEVTGYVIGYSAYIHIFGYTGDFYFDNVKLIHGAVNWARDKNCSNIKFSFSNQYYQIPKNWVALELPSGSAYGSDYIEL